MEMQPHDDVIRRLEADLKRRETKLNNKPTTYNKKRFIIVRDLLDRWKKERETKINSHSPNKQ